jgi:hypothetical protein
MILFKRIPLEMLPKVKITKEAIKTCAIPSEHYFSTGGA